MKKLIMKSDMDFKDHEVDMLLSAAHEGVISAWNVTLAFKLVGNLLYVLRDQSEIQVTLDEKQVLFSLLLRVAVCSGYQDFVGSFWSHMLTILEGLSKSETKNPITLPPICHQATLFVCRFLLRKISAQ